MLLPLVVAISVPRLLRHLVVDGKRFFRGFIGFIQQRRVGFDIDLVFLEYKTQCSQPAITAIGSALIIRQHLDDFPPVPSKYSVVVVI